MCMNRKRTALLTIEFQFHPRPDPLAPSSTPASPPFKLITHRNSIDKPLLTILREQLTERNKSKKDPPPAWINSLIFPDLDDPDAFSPPICVMRTSFDPLASVRPRSSGLQPGSMISSAYHKLETNQPLMSALKHKNFVEFPTIEVWAEGTFRGTLINDTGSLLHDGDNSSPARKRRKLNAAQSKRAMNGLLGGYGSEEETGEEDAEEKNVLKVLDGYPGSDNENASEEAGEDDQFDDGLGDEDAEGETDEEYEDDAQRVASLLETLRQSGALRADVLVLENDEDDQVDWGDFANEEDNVDDIVT